MPFKLSEPEETRYKQTWVDLLSEMAMSGDLPGLPISKALKGKSLPRTMGWGTCFRSSFRWAVDRLQGRDFYAKTKKNGTRYDGGEYGDWIIENAGDEKGKQEILAALARNPQKMALKTLAWMEKIDRVNELKEKSEESVQLCANMAFDLTMTEWLRQARYLPVEYKGLQSSLPDTGRHAQLQSLGRYPYAIVTVDWSQSLPFLGGHVRAYYKKSFKAPAYFFDPLQGEFVHDGDGVELDDKILVFGSHHEKKQESSAFSYSGLMTLSDDEK